MGNFTHLHLHSEYSLLDGACRIGDIPKMAKSMGHTAVAITDHGVLYGAVEFWRACQAEGVKPIIGCEVYVAARGMEHKEGRADLSGEHLVLLVENEVGYRNLIQLVSRSFTDGFYMKPRVDWALLSKHHEGLIALSACIAGEIPQHILAGDYERAKTRACEMQALFGEGHFYLELQDHGLADEKRVCSSLAAISRETGIPLVATNDVHYLRRRDSEMQAVLMCIQTNKVLTDGRPIGFETDEFYYKSTEEMEQLFSAYPDACANTQKIADRCQFDFVFGEYKLPTCPTEPGLSHRETLEKYAFEGFHRLSDGGHITFDRNSREEYESRIRYELDVIDKMGFSAYFLIVRDFVTYSKTHGIAVGPGRGSGAGSLVAYCVGITDVDSIRYDLLFERFLNPERLSMPDFDIDFCYENRDRAIAYVRERYGDDHVAQIITFGTLAARAAVRDVGRALDIPYATVDAVAKMIPMHATLDEALGMKELKAKYEEDEEVRRLMDLSRSVEGMPRHASTHAAGVVITEMPVSHYVPLAVNGDVVVTQYDMDTVASLGLIKFDFLGLRYLTVMEKAQTAIRESMPEFDLTRIPFDDPATYRAISQGKTEAVFQLESQGIRRVLSEMKPSCFEDIIATIALYRPGPMDSIDTFIARKHGIESATYDTPLLAPILDNTYGCIVYQEQVMQIFRSLAGYSFARADLVRRAMSKKKADVMAAEKSNFIAGCAERGISSTVAEKIFADMESFASYAFNKSHATAYAMISYRTAYLKTHFPAEYLAAIMSCGSACDPSQFDVRVLPPSINESTLGFTAGEGTVRYGFLAIKNVGRQFIEGLLDERKNGQFRSFEDFIDRMASRGEVNRRQIEAMIKCGCFDAFGVYRSRLLAVYEDVITRAVSRAHTNVTGQLDLFSALGM
ncbi:MAG: DNA polymerase III subunit alpha, partial [Clostridia bacterium]|nr:DNA polymerase III subunit alpha [Clostridia bacterium]